MKKTNYETPQAELIVVRFEENILSAKFGAKNQAGTLGDEDDDYTYSFE